MSQKVKRKDQIGTKVGGKSRYRNFFLTRNFKNRSNPTPELEPQFLGFRTPPQYAVWKWEKGSKSGILHYHLYMEFNNPISWETVHRLFEGADIRQRRGTQAQAINYVKKPETAVSEVREYGTFIEDKQGQRTDIDEMKEDIYQNGLDLEQIKQKHYSLYLRYHGAIDKMISTRKETIKLRKPEEFNVPLQDLTLPLFIYGLSGTGKTEYAKAHFQNPLVVRHIEDLRSLSSANDGIVFDDMKFYDWDPEDVIHLLDIENSSTLHARFTNVRIPASTKRIFVHNNKDIFYKTRTELLEIGPIEVPLIPLSQAEAIDRRYQEIQVTKMLFNSERHVSKKPKIIL